jgi:hypothetical protein
MHLGRLETCAPLRSSIVHDTSPRFCPSYPVQYHQRAQLVRWAAVLRVEVSIRGDVPDTRALSEDPPDNIKLAKDAIDATGFVRNPSARQALGIQHAQFAENPVAFLRKLTGLRRKGQGFLPTHLGQVLHSREIPDDEFDQCESVFYPQSCPADSRLNVEKAL